MLYSITLVCAYYLSLMKCICMVYILLGSNTSKKTVTHAICTCNNRYNVTVHVHGLFSSCDQHVRLIGG